MKKPLQFFSHLISFLVLGVLWMCSPVSFAPDPVILLFFAICVGLCPPLGLRCASRFSRGLFGTLSILCFSIGIPVSLYLGGPLVGHIVLGIGSVCLGTLIVAFLLPASSKETALLSLRGVPATQARKILFFRSAYALFFKNSGILAGTVATWLLLISGNVSFTTLWNSAGIVAVISFFGYLLFLFLGAPASAHRPATPKKSRFVFLSLLCFILLMITVYIYIGSIYTSPDPALLRALATVRSLLTPVLLATFGGLVVGVLLGLLLSVMGARFFASLCRGIMHLPVILSVALLQYVLPLPAVGFFVIVAIWSALGILEGRLAIRPYRHMSIAKRGKAVLIPLFYQPFLAHLPRIGLAGVFSCVFLDVTSGKTLFSLQESSFLLAVSILTVLFVALQILSFLTKEVHRHG